MNSGIEENLLFGLMAIQNGMIDQEQILAAYEDWNVDKSRTLADHIVARGELESDDRAVIEALVERHLKRHGGDAEQSVAALIVGRANLEQLAQYEEFTVGTTVSYFASQSGTSSDGKSTGGSPNVIRPGVPAGTRFRVLRPYAKGGLGSVSVALDTEVHREVALKQILEKHADDPVSRQRFLLEAEITGGLEHPGIVPVYGLGADARGRPFYAMRFIQGETLKETAEGFHRDRSLSRDPGRRSLELRKLLRRFIDVCNAVDYAHGRGVLHRDIKPMNVILGKHGETLLVDWGLAKALGRSDPADGEGALTPSDASGTAETLPGRAMGTPAFMSAEQAAGDLERLGPQSDVYSLGATLYYILAGRPPLTGSLAEMLSRTQEGDFPPPRTIEPSVEKALEAVCLKAMALAPEDRYATARALADDIERWQAGEPVSAWREPLSVRMRRWARKHRVAVAVAAALLIATTIGLGVSTALITRERNEAEAQGEQARKAIQLLTGAADLAFDERLDPFQEEFLKLALGYYRRFTARVAANPRVRLEHGRAYQQMGDIQRKLLDGKPAAERSYTKALELLEPLAKDTGLGRAARRSLARAQCRLADLLVRQGDAEKRAGGLYHTSLETQRALVKEAGASAVDRLRLGQTLKSQANLLRQSGQPKPASLDYDAAIAILETVPEGDENRNEAQTALALAIDSRGWIQFELGDLAGAEKDYRRALELLAGLVKKFPTIPRHREALARACNSLGLIETSTGRPAEAEGHFRRELPLVERLSEDFQEQGEYQRLLARTLMNLERVLSEQNRAKEAEQCIRRAIEVNSPVADRSPDDVQIHVDLALQHNNLGMLLRARGEGRQAIGSFQEARAISEKLMSDFPERPRFRERFAGVLTNLAEALVSVGDPEGKEVYERVIPLYERLVAEYPDNVNYKVDQASCLRNYGPLLARDKRVKEAEAVYRKALELLETRPGQTPSTDHLRVQADVLNNLGDLQLGNNISLAEATLRRAIEIFEILVERKPPALKDRHGLAIARNNLGELMVKMKRFDDAGKLYEKSVANFETLIAKSPGSTDYQSQIGIVLANEGSRLEQLDKAGQARSLLERAVKHERQAVLLSKNRDDIRGLLGSQLIQLARIELKIVAYGDAAATAVEIPGALPASERSRGCLDAARILAKVSAQARADANLKPSERDELGGKYLPRTIVLLREAIDGEPGLGERIKTEKEFSEIRLRPEFTTMLNSLVDVKGAK
jgi:eukaryotic-like serine/threonine-protein kinase